LDKIGIYAFMTPGTATPPSSDLIDRFNAIIDSVLACVAVESMKAAGVPWPLRMILAPLLRRRLARLSATFSAMVADARAGRLVARAAESPIDPPIDLPADSLAVPPPEPDARSRAMPATDRVGFVSGRRGREIVQPEPLIAPAIVVPSERRATRSERRPTWPRARPQLRTHGSFGRRLSILHVRSRLSARAIADPPDCIFRPHARGGFARPFCSG
jgi:hypothetical protein